MKLCDFCLCSHKPVENVTAEFDAIMHERKVERTMMLCSDCLDKLIDRFDRLCNDLRVNEDSLQGFTPSQKAQVKALLARK